MPEHMLRVKKWLHIEGRYRSGYSPKLKCIYHAISRKKIELVPEHM